MKEDRRHEGLQGWIEGVASVNPVTAIVPAARSLIAGAPENVGLGFAAAGGLVLGFVAWALRGLRSAEAAGG